MYNLTYNGLGLVGMMEFVNNIFPPTTAIFLLFIPFIILIIALIKFGLKVALTTASFLSLVICILLVSTGLVDASFMIMFMALTIVGFIWMSVSGGSA
jgi:hypothetical protein